MLPQLLVLGTIMFLKAAVAFWPLSYSVNLLDIIQPDDTSNCMLHAWNGPASMRSWNRVAQLAEVPSTPDAFVPLVFQVFHCMFLHTISQCFSRLHLMHSNAGESEAALRVQTGQRGRSVVQMVGVCDQVWRRVHNGWQQVQ